MPASNGQYALDVSTKSGTPTPAATSQQDQSYDRAAYRSAAANYMDLSQNNSQSQISRQLNLNLASINATMAGDANQLQQIQHQQSMLNQQSNQQLVNSATQFFSALERAAAVKKQRQAENLAKDLRRAEGDPAAAKAMAFEYSIGSKYSGIPRNKNLSIFWLKKAVDMGDTCSLFEIAKDIYLYDEEMSDQTIADALLYLCTAYHLSFTMESLGERCKLYGSAESMKRSIGQSLFLLYPSLKNSLQYAQLIVLNELFNERLYYLERMGYGKKKRQGNKSVPVLKMYISEIEEKLDDAAKEGFTPFPGAFEAFVAANNCNYKKN